MGRKPNLNALDYLFESGNDFQISDSIYEKETGVSLPKDKNYLQKRSALAEWAKTRGYIISDIEEKPIIERTVYFKKRCKK